MTTPAQEQRFRELCSSPGGGAVARYNVGRDLALVARNDAGELVAAELVDPDGQTVPPDYAASRLAARHAQAVREAEILLRNLSAVVAVARDRGAEEAGVLNLRAIALEADLSRTTLYRHLELERVAA